MQRKERFLRSFPHYIELFKESYNEQIDDKLLMLTMDIYCQKNSMNFIIMDKSNAFVKLSFVISEAQRTNAVMRLSSGDWLKKGYKEKLCLQDNVFCLAKFNASKSALKLALLMEEINYSEQRVSVVFLPYDNELMKKRFLAMSALA